MRSCSESVKALGFGRLDAEAEAVGFTFRLGGRVGV